MGLSPISIEHAHAIQDATVVMLGEPVAGWKANFIQGGVSRAPLLASRVLHGPAILEFSTPAASASIEAEIAFRFMRDMPPREAAYTRAELESSVTVLAAVEVLGTRFCANAKVTELDRMADCMSNEWLVVGSGLPLADSSALANVEVSLTVNHREVIRHNGGHPVSDPLLPALALINDARREAGVRAGCIVTTGSCTGVTVIHPGDKVTARFSGVGEVEMQWQNYRVEEPMGPSIQLPARHR